MWTGAVYLVGVAGHGTPDIGILENDPLCKDLGDADVWLGTGDVIFHLKASVPYNWNKETIHFYKLKWHKHNIHILGTSKSVVIAS
jgi:hypothetical protein